jgi:ribonuclease HI
MIIYTDGACKNNQNKSIRKAGCGVYFHNNSLNHSLNFNNISIKLEGPKQTNQVAELTACILGIEEVINKSKINNYNMQDITIKTDSMYTINCINTWFDGWKKRGWKKADGKPVDNLELIQKLHYYVSTHNIKLIHVKAHKEEPSKDDPTYDDWYGNMMADKLATLGAATNSYNN